MRRSGAFRRISLAIVLAMLASLVVVPAQATAAGNSGAFTGGADAAQYPQYVPNDHTPIAVHFSVAASGGLLPSQTYYAKVRFTLGTSPVGTTNRGYTWNPTSQSWIQERNSDWTLSPVVSTDASGAITGSMGWLFAAFGDDTQTGQWHLMVSLSQTGVASTFNSSVSPTVTVFDPRTAGCWVHNGIATGKPASKNARLVDETSTTILAQTKTEPTGVPDENYGFGANTGDFRMASLESTTVKVILNQAAWGPTTLMTGPADTDLAIGASDTTAPTAPGAPVVSSGDGTASISWAPAADDTGVAGYYVYRWTPLPTIGTFQYSPLHTRVATLGPDARSFDDSGLTNGTTYMYEVRAFDAATNVGPRSASGTAVPTAATPALDVLPASPDGTLPWYRTAPIVTFPKVAGRATLYAYSATPSVWTTYTTPITIPDAASTTTLYYCDTDGTTTSTVGHQDFHVDTHSPVAGISAPAFSVQNSATRNFTVAWSGTDAASGVSSYEVREKTGSSWTTRFASTTATSTLRTGVAGNTYTYQVRASDAAGNSSPWFTASTSVPYDQTKMSFSSSWKTYTRSTFYLGSVRYTSTHNAYAKVTIGRGILYLVVSTGPKLGRLAVYNGSHLVKTIDTYSRTARVRQVVRIATFSGSRSSIKLLNLATSHRPRIEVDGFVVR
jgi:hypothetical protein